MKRQKSSRQKPQSKLKGRIVYLPLTDEVVEKYAYKVCAKLVARDGQATPDTDLLQGFVSFFKIVAAIQLKYLNKGVINARKEI